MDIYEASVHFSLENQTLEQIQGWWNEYNVNLKNIRLSIHLPVGFENYREAIKWAEGLGDTCEVWYSSKGSEDTYIKQIHDMLNDLFQRNGTVIFIGEISDSQFHEYEYVMEVGLPHLRFKEWKK